MAVRRRAKAQGAGGGNSTSNRETSGNLRASAPAESKQQVTAPTVDEIRIRAYALFEARGGSDGNDLEDWLTAERELKGNSRDSD